MLFEGLIIAVLSLEDTILVMLIIDEIERNHLKNIYNGKKKNY